MPLGDGTGSDYPGSLDTVQTFTNGATPAADDSTRIDAELINDILNALVKIQGELGVDPSGGYIDVKTRIDRYLPFVGAGFPEGSIPFADANGRLTHQHTNIKVGSPSGFSFGIILGAPSGGDRGTGTLNAHGVYDDGALLTCYALEYENKRALDMKKWDRLSGRRRKHEPARKFMQRAKRDLDIREYSQSWKESGHLPAMPSPDEWEQGALSTGDLIQRLWETVEVQAVHIAKLNERLEALEAKAKE